jgi:hypothetical protein
LLNADQHFGHLSFSSQIIAFQQLPRPNDLVGVGSEDPCFGRSQGQFQGQLLRVVRRRPSLQLTLLTHLAIESSCRLSAISSSISNRKLMKISGLPK